MCFGKAKTYVNRSAERNTEFIIYSFFFIIYSLISKTSCNYWIIVL